MNRLRASKPYYFWTVIAVLLAGVSLRILMFFQNRSLFIDEACLSYQLIDRNYTGLFENLEYQYAPPFFSVLVKSFTQILGANEYALRLLPLLASIAGLLLFYKICKQFLEDQSIIFPVLLFTFGMPFLRYATEVKQYASDMLITMLLLWIGLKWKAEKLTWPKSGALGLLGAVCIWFSMPSVFVLFGLGMCYLFSIYQKEIWSKMIMVFTPILIWLMSFGIYYFSILSKDIGLDNLETFHQRFFLPLLPGSAQDLDLIGAIILSFFRTSIGSTTIAIVFGILCLLFGIYHTSKKGYFSLFCLPILMTLLASGLHFYSLIPRLTLFFMPIFILIIGIGQEQLFKRSPKVLKGIWWVGMIIIVFNLQGWQFFYKPYQLEELRPVLEYVEQNTQPGDEMYVHVQARHSFIFYKDFYENAVDLSMHQVRLGEMEEDASRIELIPGTRTWIILSHLKADEIGGFIQKLKPRGTILDEYAQKGATAILLLPDG